MVNWRNWLIASFYRTVGTAGECLVLVCVRVHVDKDFIKEFEA